MTENLRTEARIPRHGAYSNGSPDEHIISAPAAQHPNTNNGLIGSEDGRLRPENVMRTPKDMPAGQSFARFHNPDGTPMPVTNALGQTASDWKLVQTGPATYVREPLP